MKRTPPGACVLAAALLLAGCGSVPPSSQLPPLSSFDAVAAVAAVRASGRADATELDVQPLRDPQVQDLREQAAALETRRLYRAAADALDLALSLSPDDPAVLQERAEVALLLHRLPDAGRYAQRAFDQGSKVGPLCRRHWETIAQVRAGLAAAPTPAGVVPSAATAANTATAADARRQRDACTVAALRRY